MVMTRSSFIFEVTYDDYITYLLNARPHFIWGVRYWLCNRRISGGPWRDPRLSLLAVILYLPRDNYI